MAKKEPAKPRFNNLYNDPDKFDDLKPKQKRFIRTFVGNLNVTESCRELGISVSTGYRYLSEPLAIDYQQYLAEEEKTSKIMSHKELMERLTLIGRQEAKEEYITPKGQTIDKGTDIKDATKALELLGKTMGAYTDKVEVSTEVSFTIDIVDDDEEDEDE